MESIAVMTGVNVEMQKTEETKNLKERPDSPLEEEEEDEAEDKKCLEYLGSSEFERPETPLSDASTSGVCSLASSDSEASEDIVEEKVQLKPAVCPVIIYENRNILNLFENIHPFSLYQSTSVPKVNLSNYWERRSVYHRLGPFGKIDEIDLRKCKLCGFHMPVPKVL